MKKAIILAALLVFSAASFAEEVQLRSGVVKTGEIVEKTDTDITLQDADGNTVTVPFRMVAEAQAEKLKALPNKALPVPKVDTSAKDAETYFNNMDGCFLLYNMQTGKFDKVIGEERCQKRFPACSTFKVALSVMAFDAGVLRDSEQVLKWDGQRETGLDQREVLYQDHNARTWLIHSVVWFSKRLTAMLGEEKIKKYLHDLHYGNEDISAGISGAWLVPPDSTGPALRISAYEQAGFMTALWSGQLPVSPQAMAFTRENTYLEPSPKGSQLSGKTGSGFYKNDKRTRLGWFIGHVAAGGQEYIVVTNFTDLVPTDGSTYGGVTARAITKKVLEDQGLW